MTQFLSTEGYDAVTKVGHNYVLNLNCEWGAGKTYFLRRWADNLQNQFPIVYIDAWQQDYSDDPLLTVVTTMIKQLKAQAGVDDSDLRFKAPRKIIALLKATSAGIAQGLTKKYLGFDPVKILEAEDEGEIGTNIEEAGQQNSGKKVDMGVAASKMVEHLITEHDSKSQAIVSLKRSVEKWVKTVTEKKSCQLPAFIFIDELDRCRPSYAIEMLETIKHIFDIPGVVFVIATDTEQLQHAVKAIYGSEFGAKNYLTRFFNSRFSLKTPELNNITVIIQTFGLNIRSAIQITKRIIATITHLNDGDRVDILMLTTLHCIREIDESLYKEILSLNLNHQQDDKTVFLAQYLSHKFAIEKQQLSIKINLTNSIEETRQKLLGQNKTVEFQIKLSIYVEEIFSEYFKSVGPTYAMSFTSTPHDRLSQMDKIKDELFSDLYYLELACALDWLPDDNEQ